MALTLIWTPMTTSSALISPTPRAWGPCCETSLRPEDLARAWASLGDTRDEFDKEKGLGASEAAHGDYLGYLAETEEILRRAVKYARERSSVSSSPPANP